MGAAWVEASGGTGRSVRRYIQDTTPASWGWAGAESFDSRVIHGTALGPTRCFCSVPWRPFPCRDARRVVLSGFHTVVIGRPVLSSRLPSTSRWRCGSRRAGLLRSMNNFRAGRHVERAVSRLPTCETARAEPATATANSRRATPPQTDSRRAGQSPAGPTTCARPAHFLIGRVGFDLIRRGQKGLAMSSRMQAPIPSATTAEATATAPRP